MQYLKYNIARYTVGLRCQVLTAVAMKKKAFCSLLEVIRSTRRNTPVGCKLRGGVANTKGRRPCFNRNRNGDLILVLGYTLLKPTTSTCLDTGWTTGRKRFDPRQRQRIFPLTSVSRPTLAPIQLPVQRVLGVISSGLKGGQGVTLTTYPQLVPISRMSRSYTFSPPKRLHSV
jgi:hypothetical protein